MTTPPLDLSSTFPSSITSITSMRETNGEISNRRGVTLTASLLPPGTIPSTQSGGTSVTVNSIPTAIHTATTPSSNAAMPSTSCRLPGRASKGCPTLRQGVPRAFPRKVPGPRISGTQTMIRPGRRRAARTPCHCRTGTSTTVPTIQPSWSAAIKPTPASRAARASGSSRTLPPNLPRA